MVFGRWHPGEERLKIGTVAMGDRLDACDGFVRTGRVVAGELPERPFEDLLGQVNFQLEYKFGTRRYFDVDGPASNELDRGTPHAAHHLKIVGSIGHLD